MASNGIKINQAAFMGVCGALFGLAIMTAIARTVIRFRTAPRYTLDDALLLFACVCLIAATGLLYKLIPLAYIFEELDFENKVSLPFPISDFARESVFAVRILDAYTPLSWTVIYAAKFCYLIVFRALIDRVRRMILYWRVVVSITIVFCGLSLGETFIACPRIEVSSSECLQGAGFKRTLIVGVTAKCLDIITDVLLITIPISILWNVRIKLRQKLGIGAFLCLSIVMIVVAVIYTSRIRTSVSSFNLVWKLFWQQVGACAAVIMVSLTAFRSIFVSNKRKVDHTKAKTGVFQRFQIWLSSKRGFEDDIQHLSPSTPAKQIPPHLTLGTSFRSNQQKGLLDSRLQPPSENASSSHFQDPESGLQEEPIHLGVLGTQTGSTDTSAVTDPDSCEYQIGKEALSVSSTQGTGWDRRGHWWQMGILSAFSRPRPKGLENLA